MTIRTLLSTLAIIAIAFTSTNSSSAQVCIPLKVVGAEGTEVSKTISTPDMLLVKNNWNTDFVVPQPNFSEQYIATITSRSQKIANLDIKMFLKYSNGSYDNVFDGKIQLTPGQSRNIYGNTRIGEQPYQVNLSVGGVNSVGFSYTASVTACE